ncbi:MULTISPECIES: signal peptidase II [Pseudomonadaceae]|jgi:signal peptidase II|uniref:Lipoprotein signal peptidase n=2 Tax=Pseudomonadaceae TaxID=135621 RepID=A0AA42IS61_9GAMM|nr:MULTISPECIES: signal peptidase II [Pseudomonas]PKM33076.1 MAG: signal peptidase II [Gammaproteobacteria bacterium HGW-Gammaproteobacteria-12]MBA4682380.1 lipoprotein signal peptidase [Pseudomonas sp.]MBG0843476.1 lipoprotein signal peptidase [Pseudomonas toyotomiensis]MBG0848439.1 lipoprotein signal peptidase [Pseudomonas chengduensis]MBZ9668050.1 signal peptidase II [Pseudomonas chaetocerotis]
MNTYQETTHAPTPGLWWGIAAALALVDQGLKFAIEHLYELGSSLAVSPFFNVVHARNTGAAFSFLADAGGWQRYFFVVIALAVASTLILILRRGRPWREALGYSHILGGAVGNLIDRSVRGFVVDYLDFHYQGWHWPAFNLADIAIVGGALLLMVSSTVRPAVEAERP